MRNSFRDSPPSAWQSGKKFGCTRYADSLQVGTALSADGMRPERERNTKEMATALSTNGRNGALQTVRCRMAGIAEHGRENGRKGWKADRLLMRRPSSAPRSTFRG